MPIVFCKRPESEWISTNKVTKSETINVMALCYYSHFFTVTNSDIWFQNNLYTLWYVCTDTHTSPQVINTSCCFGQCIMHLFKSIHHTSHFIQLYFWPNITTQMKWLYTYTSLLNKPNALENGMYHIFTVLLTPSSLLLQHFSHAPLWSYSQYNLQHAASLMFNKVRETHQCMLFRKWQHHTESLVKSFWAQ